jgi:DNA polymerase-4
MGHDPRPVSPDDVEKSISADRTLDADLTTEADVRRELLRLAQDVGARVRARGLVARTVGIKIRFADFRTVTRVRTLTGWIDSTAEIFTTAGELYHNLHLDRPRIRLVGVKCENLRAAGQVAEQLTLDLPPDVATGAGPGRARPFVDSVVDAARARYGSAAIRPGSLLDYPRP